MDSFEMNKILGAVLGTCLFLVALNFAAGAKFAPGDRLIRDCRSGTSGEVPRAFEPAVEPTAAALKADIARRGRR
jgi:hypothetical protein